jgi:hypothetical protein
MNEYGRGQQLAHSLSAYYHDDDDDDIVKHGVMAQLELRHCSLHNFKINYINFLGLETAVSWVVMPLSSDTARRFGGHFTSILRVMGERSKKKTSSSSELPHLIAYFIWFIAWFILRPCRWRQYIPPKLCNPSKLQGVKIQKTAFFTVTAIIIEISWCCF